MANKNWVVEQMNGNKGRGITDVRKAKTVSEGRVNKTRREMTMEARKHLSQTSDTIRARKR